MELQSISDSDDAKSAAEGTQQPNGIALADIVKAQEKLQSYPTLSQAAEQTGTTDAILRAIAQGESLDDESLSVVATSHGVNAEICEVIGFCCSERGLHSLAYNLFVTYFQSNPRPSKDLIYPHGLTDPSGKKITQILRYLDGANFHDRDTTRAGIALALGDSIMKAVIREVGDVTDVLCQLLRNDGLDAALIHEYVLNLSSLQGSDLQLLKPVNGKTAIETAAYRGPTFGRIAAILFLRACEESELVSELRSFLQNSEFINDHTCMSMLVCMKDELKEQDEGELEECIVQAAIRGFPLTAVEIARCSPHPLEEKMLIVFDRSAHSFTEKNAYVDESVPLKFLEEFDADLYSEECVGNKGHNPLHFAARCDYAQVTRVILSKGYPKLLWAHDSDSMYPVQIALQKGYWGTAAVMVKAMADWKLCIGKEDTPPVVNFYSLLKRLKPQGNAELQDCVLAALDVTIDHKNNKVHHDILEVDDHGITPGMPGFNAKCVSCIQLVSKGNLEAVAGHESFQHYVSMKWRKYGAWLYLIPFVMYLTFMAFLTTALVLAAEVVDPTDYSTSTYELNGFRLFCEIVTFIWIIATIGVEFRDFFFTHERSLKGYFTEWSNWLDIAAIVLTLLIIPFRIAGLDAQWSFAALAYTVHGLRIFKYAIMVSGVGTYVAIIVEIVIYDIYQFVIVFLVVLLAFGGGLYFALRGGSCPASVSTVESGQFDAASNTSLCVHPEHTSELYLIWVTGIRLLLEGNIVEPYIWDGGFGGISVVFYMTFLFVVAVILLNLLIAQFSSTYDDVTEKAKVSVTLNRAKILANMETFLWKLLKLRERFSKKRVSKYQRTESSDKNQEYFEAAESKMQEVHLVVQKQMKDSRQVILDLQQSLEAQDNTIKELKADLQQSLEAQDATIKELKAAVGKLAESDAGQMRLLQETQESISEVNKAVKELLKK